MKLLRVFSVGLLWVGVYLITNFELAVVGMLSFLVATQRQD